MRAPIPILSALLAASCGGALGGGGGDSDAGRPLPTQGEPAELVYARARTDSFDDAQLRTAAATGLGERRLLDRTGVERDVRIAPDGNRLAFVRERRRNAPDSRELFVASRDGSVAELRLTVDGAVDGEPCWAPDGGRIAFVSDRLGAGPRLFVIGADGTGLAPLYDDGSAQGGPDWSWAEDRIAFSRKAGAGPTQIWVVDRDGRVAAPVTDGGPAGVDRDPAWAPDGRSIVFVRELPGGLGSLARVDLRSGLVDLLTEADGRVAEPRWSPRGDRLFFVADRPGRGIGGPRLWTARADGSGRALLFGDLRYDFVGLDVLPGIRPAAAPDAEVAAADLELAEISNALGRPTQGRTDFLLREDGLVFGIGTTGSNGRQVAGLEVDVPLPVGDPFEVRAVELSAVVALTEPTVDSVLRLALRNFEAGRNDSVVELTPADAGARTIGFTVASLQHVDRRGHVRLAVVADNPFDREAELLIDAILVRVHRPPPAR